MDLEWINSQSARAQATHPPNCSVQKSRHLTSMRPHLQELRWWLLDQHLVIKGTVENKMIATMDLLSPHQWKRLRLMFQEPKFLPPSNMAAIQISTALKTRLERQPSSMQQGKVRHTLAAKAAGIRKTRTQAQWIQTVLARCRSLEFKIHLAFKTLHQLAPRFPLHPKHSSPIKL